MAQSLKTRRRIITIIYWVLLLYIIAALVFWFIELETQNREMTGYRISLLNADDPQYMQKIAEINDHRNRHFNQYVGEGVTFLLLILVCAVYLFRAVRRQFRLQQQQENFMMAVTHELKTPIAITRLNLQTLQKHKLDEAKQNKLIESTLKEASRLDQLANNILVSAQLESGRYHRAREEFDLSAATREIVSDAQHRFMDKQWNIAFQESILFTGDEVLIQMLVSNLLENAVKYSPPGTTIGLDLHKGSESIVLKVSDEGVGIPVKERKYIFDKFYRVGNEQTRVTKGTGLGLYLCRKIAEAHRARIQVTDNTPRGSVFTVTFKT